VFSGIYWDGAEKSGVLQEIVINLTVPSSSAVGSSSSDLFHQSTLGDLLFDSIMAARRGSLKYTLVNSDALPVRLLRAVDVDWCEDDHPQTYAAFKTAASFQECAETYLQEAFERESDRYSEDASDAEGDSDFGDEWNKDGRIQFLTSAEYEAKVGTATYRLETLERPWEL
jgi:hypothetical protein